MGCITRRQYEDEIRAQVISWLLPRISSCGIIGSEVQFLDGKRRADIVLVSSQRLVAIEIKGPRDDLRKLPDQLKSYNQMFKEVYIAVDAAMYLKIRKNLPSSVGIIKLDQNSVIITKKAKAKKNLVKRFAAHWLLTSELKSIVRSSTNPRYLMQDKKSLIDQIQESLTKHELNDFAIQSLKNRLSKRYHFFINELGSEVTLDDLRVLKLESTVQLGS